jgi:hypothetical protein
VQNLYRIHVILFGAFHLFTSIDAFVCSTGEVTPYYKNKVASDISSYLNLENTYSRTCWKCGLKKGAKEHMECESDDIYFHLSNILFVCDLLFHSLLFHLVS